MKASEAIERIKALMAVCGGDPDVLIEIDSATSKVSTFEAAAFETTSVSKKGKNWQAIDNGNSRLAIVAF